MRLLLAFQAFFRVLFGKPLPAKLLPPAPEPPPALPAKVEAPAPAPKAQPNAQRDGALALLALFQREGRLVDFLREDLGGHPDAAIGAAARDVHRGCQKVLEQHFGFEPVLPGDEDAAVTVPRGFDPAE